jgi:hypothetical protein
MSSIALDLMIMAFANFVNFSMDVRANFSSVENMSIKYVCLSSLYGNRGFLEEISERFPVVFVFLANLA